MKHVAAADLPDASPAAGRIAQVTADAGFDHGSDPRFFSYYEAASLSAATVERFRIVRDKVLKVLADTGRETSGLRVADIGCGAGTQCRLWAEAGHHVHGIDVNGPLVELGRRRAEEAGLAIRFEVGTATALPYDDASMDVVLMPELLEHVADWESCVREGARVLAPGGAFYLSTTNALCPRQDEFNLPLYSWYPGFMKRRYERLAVTSRPEIANYAKYPAVHWFTFYQLRDYLRPLGLDSLDRFDLLDTTKLGAMGRLVGALGRLLPPLRYLGHVMTVGTTVLAIKHR